MASAVPIVATAYALTPIPDPEAVAQGRLLAELSLLADEAALSPPAGPVLSDPTPVLNVLAVDPVVRAMRAEQLALASRGQQPVALSLPAGLEAMHPTVAAKTAQALRVLALPAPPPPPAAKPKAFRPLRWLGLSLRKAPARRSAPTQWVAGAIAQASGVTGVSSSYLQQAARRESAFDPFAQASTSSAVGLFQFIESTWLDLMRKHGASYGYEAEARAIYIDERGRPAVRDPQVRARILSLRLDPHLASIMAGHLTRENAQALQSVTGRPATAGDLYLAHVLGVDGAVQLMRAAIYTPDRPASAILPRAAAANRPLFYRGAIPLSARTTYLLIKLKGETA